MARLKEEYKNRIRQEIVDELKLGNLMAAPTIKKIVVNSGVGEAVTNSAAIDEVVEILELITGQKPVVSKSKKAVSAFKLRENMDIGVHVTLRGEYMWEFFDKLINVVLPRTKDFRGLPVTSFDNDGNYSLGIEEHTVFPEIDHNKVQKIRSLQVTIVMDSKDSGSSKLLLDKFGFPFKKDGKEIKD